MSTIQFLLSSDFPRPLKNLRLVEEVPGTVTLQWDHSPDLSDVVDGAHYVILKRDTSTTSWFTLAERVFSSRYTVTGILPGRKYFFRVIAQNSIGDSDPLDSKEPFAIAKEKGECVRYSSYFKCFVIYKNDKTDTNQSEQICLSVCRVLWQFAVERICLRPTSGETYFLVAS